MSFPSNRPTPIQELIDDGVLLINDGYRAKNSELGDAGLPFARAGNINNGFQFEGVDRFPKENRNKLGVKVSQPGDVVFTSKGTVGRFAFVSRDTQEFVYSPQLCFWRSLDHSRLNPRWLYYWMNGREFFSQFKGVSSQSDMAEYVSLRDQRSMEITLADAKEQSSISNILGSLDDKIALNRKLNETLEKMARALFQSWLVDFDPVKARLAAKRRGRDPEHACMAALSGKLRIPPGKPRTENLDDQLPTADELDAAIASLDTLTKAQRQQLTQLASSFSDDFQDSGVGLIPGGWKVMEFGEIAQNIRNQVDPTKLDPNTPYVGLEHIEKRCFALSTWGGAYEVDSQKSFFEPGDFLFGKLRPYFHKVCTVGVSGICSTDVLVIRAKKDIYRGFVGCQISEESFVEYANIRSTGTRMPRASWKDMAEYQIAIPEETLLRKFSLHVEPQWIYSIELNHQSRTLAELRDTLLPKLLSGELSVGAAEDAVEAVAP